MQGTRLSLLLALFLLSGCGQNLGAYHVEEVRLTTDAPLRSETAAHYGQFLEVRLTSKTSLTALADEVDGIGGVYVGAHFCPLRNEDGVTAFGPFSDDGKD